MMEKRYTLILVVIFIVDAVLTTVYFKPADILSNTPIYTDDYAMHFSQCLSARRFLTTAGKTWGYDPFLLAGFPRGVLHPDIIALELLFTVLSPVLGDGFAFKLYVLLFLLFYPFCIYGAARNYGLKRETSVIAMLMGILFFHLSLAVDFVAWGMVSYVMACFFSIYVLSLFLKLFKHFSWQRYIIATLAASGLQLLHVLAMVHICVPILFLYLCSIRRLRWYQHIVIVLIPCVVILSNSFWLLNLIEFIQYKTDRSENYTFTLQINNLYEILRVYIDQTKTQNYKPAVILNNTFIDVYLMLFAIGGMWLWRKKRLISLWIPILLGIIWTIVLAYCGSKASLIAQLQPERFNIALSILLLIPASFCMVETFKNVFYQKNRAAVLFIILMGGIILYRPVIRPFVIIFKHDLYRLNCEFPEQLIELIDFLNKNTTEAGRVLIEDSEYLDEDSEHQFYGGHFPGLLPEYVKREFLCGPRPMYPMKQSYASFTRGLLFEKKIEAYTTEELKASFNTYNVKWIVCWYDASKKVFNHMSDYIHFLGQIDKFAIYEVKRNSSFFLKGSGSVKADFNMLSLENITSEDGEIVICYHWLETLQTIPAAAMGRVFVGDDPVGFIKVKSPPEKLIIINKY